MTHDAPNLRSSPARRKHRTNTQMFALRDPPPTDVTVAEGRYRLLRVFKHDFFAATCLYESSTADRTRRIVVKWYRTQAFCGFPLRWMGRVLCRHERQVYAALTGVRGIPQWIGSIDGTALVVEYVDALPLDQLPSPPTAAFFGRLRKLFDDIHARGVAYCDANKRSNILAAPDGRPFLVDFQISIRRRDRWPQPLKALAGACTRYVQRSDLYHLYKHKRRLCPGALTAEEERLSRRRGRLHSIHRKLTDPWRAIRRRFLAGQYAAGRLVSPTADAEDHAQPEKATWRKEKKAMR